MTASSRAKVRAGRAAAWLLGRRGTGDQTHWRPGATAAYLYTNHGRLMPLTSPFNYDFAAPRRIVFGWGRRAELSELAVRLGSQTLVVWGSRTIADSGVGDALRESLAKAGLQPVDLCTIAGEPSVADVDRAVEGAATLPLRQTVVVAVGGGSAIDLAKAVAALAAQDERRSIVDYLESVGQGAQLARPSLPLIAMPTTAGTGSEAQTYALISDAETHVKMACGDAQAAFKVAILDPRLTLTQPNHVTATAGYDAIAHAVESFVTAKRTPMSDVFAREAWRLLASNYERVLAEPQDIMARGAMLLGSHYAGAAIENSMLGATHACANPLTARYGTAHGVAIAVMLPHVVRWNAGSVGARYTELAQVIGLASAEQLAERLAQLARAGGLPQSLRSLDVPKADLSTLAEAASKQWTGTFNPRPFSAASAEELYTWAY